MEKERKLKAQAAPVARRAREAFFALIGKYLKTLYRFVGHELAYLEAVGDLSPGELTADEVVDTVLLRAYLEYVKRPTDHGHGGWLIRLAREQIEADMKRLRSERELAPFRKEDDVPETPPEEWVSTLGEEILYFYEPEEDLKLEDVVPDVNVPTPEEEAERKEMWLCVARALARMPRDWRRAWVCQVSGLEAAELAEAVGKPEPEARQLVKQAHAQVRQELLKEGCRPMEADERVP